MTSDLKTLKADITAAACRIYKTLQSRQRVTAKRGVLVYSVSHNSAYLALEFEAQSVMYTPAVVDVTSVRFLLAALGGWLNRQQHEVTT